MQRDINVNVSGPMQPTSTYKTVVLKGNQPFALQVTEPNMKYVIKHNFDLGGGSVTIPANCILEFDGGSLSNGTLVGNYTRFERLSKKNLLCDFGGTFESIDINANVVGLDAEQEPITNQQNKFEKLANLIQCTKNVTVSFNNGYYGFGGGSTTPYKETGARGYYNRYALDIRNGITENLTIIGSNTIFKNLFAYYIGAWNFETDNYTPNYDWETSTQYQKEHISTVDGGFLKIFSDIPLNTTLKGFEVDGNRSIMKFGGYQYWSVAQCGISIVSNGGNVLIDNIYCHGNVTDGFIAQNAKRPNNVEYNLDSVVVKNCIFSDNISSGCSPCSGKKIIINNCTFRDNGQIYYKKGYMFEGPYCDMDIEPNPRIGTAVYDVYIDSCVFENFNTASILCLEQKVKNFSLTNCVFSAKGKIKDYSTTTRDGITEGNNFPLAYSVEGIVDTINVDNMVINDCRVEIPTLGEYPEQNPNDTSVEQYYYKNPNEVPNKSTHIGKIVINQTICNRTSYYFAVVPHNYKWNVTQQEWQKIYVYDANTANAFPALYGSATICDMVINMKTPSTLCDLVSVIPISKTNINNLSINLYCAFDDGTKLFINPGGSPNTVTRINNLYLNDYYEGSYEGEIVNQGNPPVDNRLYNNILYSKLKGNYSAIRWTDKTTDIAICRDRYDNGIYKFLLTSDKSKYVDLWLFRTSNPSVGSKFYVTNDVDIHIDEDTTQRVTGLQIYWNGSSWTDSIGRLVTR